MNLAIRGIEADLGAENADSFLRDLHKDRQFDFVIANPPFNMKEWGGEQLKKDSRWKYGIPPEGNANYAWIQHFIWHLAPHGLAGFVLANGSMSSQQSGEGDIRKAIIEADLVDCMVALPSNLFYSTTIQACLWFLSRNKNNGRYRDRRGETLFIDARDLGIMKDRVHKELTDMDVSKITGTYHAWRGDENSENYQDIAGFCKSVTTAELEAQNYILTPGRFVGMAAKENEDSELYDTKMQRLTSELYTQFEESSRLEKEIKANLLRITNVI